jgi:hypothetical protein
MAADLIDWKSITPNLLVSAVDHIRGRFDHEAFRIWHVTQQMCFSGLHPERGQVAPVTFKKYLDMYLSGIDGASQQSFDDLLQIGIANQSLISVGSVEWAKSHVRILIAAQEHRIKLWTKQVCDEQPFSDMSTPEGVEETLYWHNWRAPRFVHMKPSGNTLYDSSSAWLREDQERTRTLLDALSERFLTFAKIHLDRIAGEAHVLLAKKGQTPMRTSPPEKAVPREDAKKNHPVAFISYSWEDDDHKKWVLDFASRLQGEGGVEVILDRWQLPLGGDKTTFMEHSVAGSDFVILICTPAYATRANQRTGGVGYEAMIISGQLAEDTNQNKFIPVLRAGDWKAALPSWIKTKLGVDFRGNPYLESEYENLVRALHQEPLKPPPVGPKPRWQDDQDIGYPLPTRSSSKMPVKQSLRLFNFDGSEGPILVSGKQASAGAPETDLYCVATVVNYTQTPIKITSVRLRVDGADDPLIGFFFRLKSDPLSKFSRISVVGNHKEDYELHFIFSKDAYPVGRSGQIILETDSQDGPIQVDVNFP